MPWIQSPRTWYVLSDKASASQHFDKGQHKTAFPHICVTDSILFIFGSLQGRLDPIYFLAAEKIANSQNEIHIINSFVSLLVAYISVENAACN